MSLTSRSANRVLSLGAAAVLALSLAACGGGSDSASGSSGDCKPAHEGLKTVTEGELTVATYDYPPFTTINGDNLTGIEGDLLTEIAKRECLTLKVDSAGGASASIPSVQSGRADLAAGSWTRTKKRAEIVRLGTPVVLAQDAIVSKGGLNTNQLEGKKVGSVVGNLFNDSLQKWLGSDFTIYQDDESIYGDLAAGRIDALVANVPTAKLRLKDNPIEGVTVVAAEQNPNVPEFSHPGQVNWPTSLDNQALGEALDADVNTLRSDGTISKVLATYGQTEDMNNVGEPYDR